MNIDVHNAAQLLENTSKGGAGHHFKGKTVLKFEMPLTIGVKNPLSYMYISPTFDSTNPFLPVSAPISRKDSYRQPLTVVTIIDVPTETTTYHIREGEVLAYLWASEGLQLTHFKFPDYKGFRGRFIRGLKHLYG